MSEMDIHKLTGAYAMDDTFEMMEPELGYHGS